MNLQGFRRNFVGLCARLVSEIGAFTSGIAHSSPTCASSNIPSPVPRGRVGWGFFLAIIFGCAVTESTFANTTFSIGVTATGIYGDGSIYIFLSGPISAPGCTVTNRIDVASTHPQVKQFLALAVTAKTAGLKIEGAVNGCDPNTGNPTFDTSRMSYMYLID